MLEGVVQAFGTAMIFGVYIFYMWVWDVCVGKWMNWGDGERLRRGREALHTQLAAELGFSSRKLGCGLHVVELGDAQQPTVVFLHGFPENWTAFWPVLQRLKAAGGLRLVALNLRGYGLSDVASPSLEAVSLTALVADVHAALRELDVRRPLLVGHDWGGVVAWAYAALHGSQLSSLLILNAPHPVVMKTAVQTGTNLAQVFRSWYVIAFLLPTVPESMFASNPRRMAHALFYWTSTDRRWLWREPRILEAYASGWLEPAALTTQLNYYRSSMRRPELAPRLGPIQVPVRVLWGLDDTFLDASHLKELQAQKSRWCPNLSVHPIAHCGHWITHEAPDAVAEMILSMTDGLD